MNSQRYRNWCFTAFTDPAYNEVDYAQLRGCRYMVYQHEICPETGQDHWQGYVEFTTSMRLSRVKEVLGDSTMHLERRLGSRDQARDYCMKLDTAFPGEHPREFGQFGASRQGERNDLSAAKKKIQAHTSWDDVINDEELIPTVARHRQWAREVYEHRPVEFPVPDIQLYGWEQEAAEYLEGKPQKRKIIWIWSSESGTGKSTFFDYCSSKWSVLPGADYSNTLYAYDGHDIIWFDLTRSQSAEHLPYHALEKLSNGGFHMSTKYVSVRKFVFCHIVVTANIPPDETCLPSRCSILHAVVAPAVPAGSPDLLDDS